MLRVSTGRGALGLTIGLALVVGTYAASFATCSVAYVSSILGPAVASSALVTCVASFSTGSIVCASTTLGLAIASGALGIGNRSLPLVLLSLVVGGEASRYRASLQHCPGAVAWLTVHYAWIVIC
jgi:hypothetical protein